MEAWNFDPEKRILSDNRIELYHLIYERMLELLEKPAKTVLSIATAGSIKDILCTVPLADNARIIICDLSLFEGKKLKKDEEEKIKKYYREKYSGEVGTTESYLNTGLDLAYGTSPLIDVGIKDFILWELESLGIDQDGISIDTVNSSISCNYYSPYGNTIKVTIEYHQINTVAWQSGIGTIEESLQNNEIDVIVDKCSQQAFIRSEEFTKMVLKNTQDGAIALADHNYFKPPTLMPFAINELYETLEEIRSCFHFEIEDIGENLRKFLEENPICFGYDPKKEKMSTAQRIFISKKRED